jgi:hypothetical protein
MTEAKHAGPAVEFLSLYPDIPMPEPATPDVAGSLPVRALRYCTPVVTATGYGWIIKSPADFALRWDGQQSAFSLVDDANRPQAWTLLDGGVDVFLPGSERIWDDVPPAWRADLRSGDGAPQVFHEAGIPFVNADPRNPQLLETITGLIARTPPGWSILTRALPNWPYAGFQVLEGIMETEWFRSCLPVMIRLTEPGRVVVFRRGAPMALAQPVLREAYDPMFVRNYTVKAGLQAFTEQDWAEFVGHRRRRLNAEHRVGTYRDEVNRHSRIDIAAEAAHDDEELQLRGVPQTPARRPGP